MSPRRAKYRELVDKVFSKPRLFFKQGKISHGWVIPEVNLRALMYHLLIGVGTAYNVEYGIEERLEQVPRQKVSVDMRDGKHEGEVIIRMTQGDFWVEYGPFMAEEIVGANPTRLLLDAARYGRVIPLSVCQDIQEKLRLWIEERKTGQG